MTPTKSLKHSFDVNFKNCTLIYCTFWNKEMEAKLYILRNSCCQNCNGQHLNHKTWKYGLRLNCSCCTSHFALFCRQTTSRAWNTSDFVARMICHNWELQFLSTAIVKKLRSLVCWNIYFQKLIKLKKIVLLFRYDPLCFLRFFRIALWTLKEKMELESKNYHTSHADCQMTYNGFRTNFFTNVHSLCMAAFWYWKVIQIQNFIWSWISSHIQ